MSNQTIITNPDLTANLLHKAYGSSISIPVRVLAEAIFFSAVNSLSEILTGEEQFVDHIKTNFKAYAFNLDQDAIELYRDDVVQFFDAMIECIKQYRQSNRSDYEVYDQMKECLAIVRMLKRSKHFPE